MSIRKTNKDNEAIKLCIEETQTVSASKLF